MSKACERPVSPWRMAFRPTRQLDFQKTSRMVIGSGFLQIAVALALVVMYFLQVDLPTDVLMLVLAPVVILGNLLLMRSARRILAFEQQLGIIRDTMRSEAELNRLLRAQRHDFLNHLQVVYSLLQLDEHDEAEAYLHRVYQDMEQVGSQLRTDNPAVNALLAAKAVQAEQRHVRLDFELRTTLLHLPMEDWELCRILANLIDNALDAAGTAPAPWVRVHLWQDVAALHGEISNNGPVIPRDRLDDIFEPGYTTKGEHGTGMGLYIVRTTMEQCHGIISVESSAQKTCFTLSIPMPPAAPIRPDDI